MTMKERRGAQLELAKAYRDGTGVNVDLTQSYLWFSIVSLAEVAQQREWAARDKKWNANNPRFAVPITIEKGGRHKSNVTKSQNTSQNLN
jgi:TPR repeat protein